jgi:hypothetical protein
VTEEDGPLRHMMDFRLRSPCASCPFRTDRPFYLRPGRVRDIEDCLTKRDETFACHMTIDYDHARSDEHMEAHCAGALILMRRALQTQPRLIQIAERLGIYDPARLDLDAPVYQSFDEMADAMEAMESSGRPPGRK